MQKIILRYLEAKDKTQFEEAYNSNWGDFDFANDYKNISNCNYDHYRKIHPQMSLGLQLPDGYVPCTFLFAFNENNELVGRTSIRHKLNDYLLKVGGHIGYGVVPKYRRQGYATQILSESLNYIKQNISNLKKLLVTCNHDNIGSIKTIVNNGGILENKIKLDHNIIKLRYWINL